MSSAAAERTQPCPACGAEIRADARFVVWCAACDWNVDPTPEEEHNRLDGLDRARRALARRHGERLLAEVTEGENLRARRDTSSLLAYAIAIAVHAVTAVLALSGIWCLLSGWGGVGIALGVVLLVAAWALRPRPPGLPQDALVLHRADAPELYALVDQVAQVVGTRGVDLITVDAKINASVILSTVCAGVGC